MRRLANRIEKAPLAELKCARVQASIALHANRFNRGVLIRIYQIIIDLPRSNWWNIKLYSVSNWGLMKNDWRARLSSAEEQGWRQLQIVAIEQPAVCLSQAVKCFLKRHSVL